MAFSQREVWQICCRHKLSLEAATDEKLKAYYDDHAVQYRKDEVDLSMIVLAEAEAPTVRWHLMQAKTSPHLLRKKH